MAPFSALLRRGASTQTLTISGDFSPPDLGADVSLVGGTGTSDPRLVRESLGSPVRMNLPVVITNSTQAGLVSAVDTLETFLRGGECTLEVSFTDSASATIWTVYHAQPVQRAFTGDVDLGRIAELVLQLLVSPFVVKAAVSLYTAEAVTAPDSLSLSTMTGAYKTPLTIEATATSSDTHSLYLAIDRDSFDAYLSDAADLTWDAGATDTADSDARSGTGVYVASVTAVTAAIDTSDYPEGPYLILARVKVKNSKTGYVTSNMTSDVVTFTRATWHIVELGTCYLPTRRVTGTASADLVMSVYGSSAATGDEACIDWVYALPIGDGMFSWHPSTDTVDATVILRDAATATTYVDDVADEEHVTGNTLMALGGKLLIVAEEAAGTDPTHAMTIDLSYVPRFGWMR